MLFSQSGSDTEMFLKEISANLPHPGGTWEHTVCHVFCLQRTHSHQLQVKLGRRLHKVSVCGGSIRLFLNASSVRLQQLEASDECER